MQYPHLSRAKVRHIEFVLLAPRKVLAVLIADTGKVEQRVIDVGQDFGDDALAELRTRFLGCALRDTAELVAAVAAVRGWQLPACTAQRGPGAGPRP